MPPSGTAPAGACAAVSQASATRQIVKAGASLDASGSFPAEHALDNGGGHGFGVAFQFRASGGRLRLTPIFRFDERPLDFRTRVGDDLVRGEPAPHRASRPSGGTRPRSPRASCDSSSSVAACAFARDDSARSRAERIAPSRSLHDLRHRPAAAAGPAGPSTGGRRKLPRGLTDRESLRASSHRWTNSNLYHSVTRRDNNRGPAVAVRQGTGEPPRATFGGLPPRKARGVPRRVSPIRGAAAIGRHAEASHANEQPNTAAAVRRGRFSPRSRPPRATLRDVVCASRIRRDQRPPDVCGS